MGDSSLNSHHVFAVLLLQTLWKYLSIFTEVCPHACPVPSAHQHMVGEVVNPGHLTRKLASGGIIVISDVCHYIIKPEHLVAFVRVLETHVKRDLVVS